MGFEYVQTRKLPGGLPGIVSELGIAQPHFVFAINDITRPSAVAVSPDAERVFVTESRGERLVRIYDYAGKPIGAFAPPATAPTTRAPSGIAISKFNEVFVVDTYQHTVTVYSIDGEFLRHFYPEGNPVYKWTPVSVAFDSAGNLYVADQHHPRHQVLVFDQEGKLKLQFGYFGIGSTDSGDAIFAFQHKTGDQVVDRIVPDANGLPTLVLDVNGDPVLIDTDLDPITDPADLVELYELDLGADGLPGGTSDDADTYVLSPNADGDQDYLVADATPTAILDEAGDPIPVFLGDGTPLGNLLKQPYVHEAYAYSCGYNGEGCHGGTKNLNRMLSCLGCHVSHGTSASMGTYASSLPWPGEDSTTADGLPGTAMDASAMDGWLDVDDLNSQYTDSDWSDRSSLLRLDNRGVCQNAYCHPKGNDNMHFGPDDFEQGQDFDYGGGGDH